MNKNTTQSKKTVTVDIPQEWVFSLIENQLSSCALPDAANEAIWQILLESPETKKMMLSKIKGIISPDMIEDVLREVIERRVGSLFRDIISDDDIIKLIVKNLNRDTK